MKFKFKNLFLGILVAFATFPGISHGLPIGLFKNLSLSHNFDAEKMISFMQTYGYLSRPSEETEGLQAESLYAESAITDGIKAIQKFGALAETGKLDEDTVKLFSAPRCGVKDVLSTSERQKRYVIGAKNWGKRQITYFIANWSPKVNQTNMEEAADLAFEAWAKYSRLKFKRVYDPSADIIIAFGSHYHGDRYPFDGPGNILAHAFYPYEENSFGGDIHFDNDENWLENADTMDIGVDFLSVLVHELGHSLGLAHSFVYNSLMFPYYKGKTPAQLDYDDILAMYQMYITRPLEENADPSNATTVTADPDHSTISSDEEKEVFIDSESTTKRTTTIETSTVIGDREPVPDICEGFLDDVAMINNEVLVFKRKYVWKFDRDFNLEDDYPRKISNDFPNLPKRFDRIDAIYQDPQDRNELLIFRGREFISYDVRGPIFSAFNLTRFTHDPEITKIDAAMVWSKNHRLYLFSSERFWKYSRKYQMDAFYPRVMARWKGVPSNLDAALSLSNRRTIFFKQDEYWEFDNEAVRLRSVNPGKIRELFGHC